MFVNTNKSSDFFSQGQVKIKRYMCRVLKISINILLWLVVFLGAGHAIGQEGEQLYKKYCASCHTIGGGKLVGPDLAGITSRQKPDWIKRFVTSSADMVKSGDPAAIAIAKEYNNMVMPPFAGTGSELSTLMTFLESTGNTVRGATKDTFLLAAGESNVSRGRDLFTGLTRLSGSGPSCIACHSVQGVGGVGGTLAKSLNLSWFTLRGAGIRSMMQSPAFPAMVNAYGAHPLTDGEIYDIAAFLRSNSQAFAAGRDAGVSSPFFLAGMAGFAGGILLLWMLWRMRKRESVNREIFARQMQTGH